MATFSPKIEEEIPISGEVYSFQPIPNLDKILYRAKREKSEVYRLRRTSDGTLFALKVFNDREERLINSTEKLYHFRTLYGLEEITDRICITEDNNKRLIETYP